MLLSTILYTVPPLYLTRLRSRNLNSWHSRIPYLTHGSLNWTTLSLYMHT